MRVESIVPRGDLSFEEPRHFELERLAHQLAATGQHDLAVVVAQTACEVFTELAVSRLLERNRLGGLGRILSDSVRVWSLADDRGGQRIFNELTGSQIQQQNEWWRAYKEHLGRRHRVIHGGARVSSDEAHASLAATESSLGYVARRAVVGLALAAWSGRERGWRPTGR
jgi:hypothetical protein